MHNVLILIPAYNESSTITRIVTACLQYTPHVMVIDDGSTDDTAAQVRNTAAMLDVNPVNQGKGATLLKGFQLAVAQNMCGVITIDADGQHNPADLPRFLACIEKNPEVMIVGARRLSTENAPTIRLWANKIADFFISCVAHKRLYDTQSGYRYYPVSFLSQWIATANPSHRFAFEADVLLSAIRSGYDVRYLDIVSQYPVDARSSHYCVGRDTWQIAKTVVRYLRKSV